jgi:hypothetical protein
VRALKRAEDSGRVILRLQEGLGGEAVVDLAAATPIASLREVDGCEQPMGESFPPRDILPVRLGPFGLRTLEVALAPPSPVRARPRVVEVPLPFDCEAASFQGQPAPDFEPGGRSYPAEPWPAEIELAGARIPLGTAKPGRPTALRCDGRRLSWSEPANRLVLLVASTEGDRQVSVQLGERETEVAIDVPFWTGPIGRWKGWKRGPRTGRWSRPGTGFVKTSRIAWTATHRHDSRGADEPYESSYLFAIVFEATDLDGTGLTSLRLPDSAAIKLFAVAPLIAAPPHSAAVSPWLGERSLS